MHNFTRECQSHWRKNLLPHIRYVATIPCESLRHKSNTFHANISILHMFMSITFTTFSLHLLRCKNDTVEFLAFPIRVLNSNYRLRTDRLATVHECDQGTNTMSFTSHYTVSDNKCLSQRQMSRDVKVSRPCWSRDRKLWSRSRTIRSRSRSHEDVGLGLTHVGLVVSK